MRLVSFFKRMLALPSDVTLPGNGNNGNRVFRQKVKRPLSLLFSFSLYGWRLPPPPYIMQPMLRIAKIEVKL